MIKDGSFVKKFSAAGFIIALGIIYGDIGTSPLYVFTALIKNTVISKELIYGSISCIFWTLTIQTTFKYVILILQADNRGEGGIFALYTLVRRKVKWLYIPAIIGASMLLADGIITPPISISNAIEGIRNIDFFETIIVPGNKLTVGIVITIISLLFFFQRFGTKIVGYSFGPVMFIWFTMILFLGLANIVQDISILKALNPYYGYKLLTQYTGGFWLLGAVFLCTTGAEALYSDLGHCGKKNIQFSWMYVKLALVCNYLGQGVWLLKHQGQILYNQNPFYEIMPSWFLFIGVCIATVATIIASQALISGSFTLINEAVNLNFWPRITIKFPSNIKGQLYIPSLNIILWFGCVGIMLWFRKAENMEAAYGFAISTTMIMTTLLMSFYIFVIRKWNKILSSIILFIFICVETSFFIANSIKLFEAWVVFLFASILISIMLIWEKSKKVTKKYLIVTKMNLNIDRLIELSNDTQLPIFANHLVYLTRSTNSSNIEKRIIDSILFQKPKRANFYWFIHIESTDEPFQMDFTIHQLIPNKIIRIDFKLGFKMQPRVNILFKKVLQHLYETNQIKSQNKYENLNPIDFHTEITYVIMESFFSIENELPFFEDLLMDIYFTIKKLSQSDPKAFGLDNATIIIEKVPLIIAPKEFLNIKQIN